MTELETQLISTLKTLEQKFNEQHNASVASQSALQTMFETTSMEYSKISAQVENLSKQLERLSR